MVRLNLSNTFTKEQQDKALDIIENATNENYIIRNKNITLSYQNKPLLKEITYREIIKELDKEDLTYRKTNMYKDFRRINATSQAKTTLRENRADVWFDEVFEEFKRDNQITTKRANVLWKMAKDQSAILIEDAELSRNFWDMYKDVFG